MLKCQNPVPFITPDLVPGCCNCYRYIELFVHLLATTNQGAIFCHYLIQHENGLMWLSKFIARSMISLVSFVTSLSDFSFIFERRLFALTICHSGARMFEPFESRNVSLKNRVQFCQPCLKLITERPIKLYPIFAESSSLLLESQNDLASLL